MPNFAHYFSYDQFLLFVENDRGFETPETESKARERYASLLYEQMSPALTSFFKALKAEGRFHHIPDCEGYSTRLINNWNAIATENERFKRDEQACWGVISYDFNHRFMFGATYPIRKQNQKIKDGAPTEPGISLEAAYQGLVSKVNAGAMPWYDFNVDQECNETGVSVRFNIDQWQITAGLTPKDFKKDALDPLPPVEKERTLAIPMTFKSEDLLVADWFRIDEFTQAVKDEAEYESGHSINCRVGMEYATRRYAEQFGFISVSVGNSSPDIFRDKDNTLIFGHAKETKSGYTCKKNHVGWICTDLWWVTAIEKSRLIEIVAGQTGDLDSATKKVETYLQENDVVQIKINPGTHHLYFNGHYEHFKKMAPAGAHLKGLERVFFALSEKDLRLESDLDCVMDYP